MLELCGVSKTFEPGTVNERKALRNVDLYVENEDFITVIGANGAGKSTLFNAISGDFYPDEGKVILDGVDVTRLPEFKRARSIGRLFQDPMRGTAPHMSIEENLLLAGGGGGWLTIAGKAVKRTLKEKLFELQMGLEDRMNDPVGSLSGGQRQAVSLVMNTLVPPKLLLLDEHTAALDPDTAEKVLHITQRVVCEHRLTCLMITHDMQQALSMGNRTIMMNRGKIIFDVAGEERANLSVSDLLRKFKENSGETLNNDRMLLGSYHED